MEPNQRLGTAFVISKNCEAGDGANVVVTYVNFSKNPPERRAGVRGQELARNVCHHTIASDNCAYMLPLFLLPLKIESDNAQANLDSHTILLCANTSLLNTCFISIIHHTTRGHVNT